MFQVSFKALMMYLVHGFLLGIKDGGGMGKYRGYNTNELQKKWCRKLIIINELICS